MLRLSLRLLHLAWACHFATKDDAAENGSFPDLVDYLGRLLDGNLSFLLSLAKAAILVNGRRDDGPVSAPLLALAQLWTAYRTVSYFARAWERGLLDGQRCRSAVAWGFSFFLLLHSVCDEGDRALDVLPHAVCLLLHACWCAWRRMLLDLRDQVPRWLQSPLASRACLDAALAYLLSGRAPGWLRYEDGRWPFLWRTKLLAVAAAAFEVREAARAMARFDEWLQAGEWTDFSCRLRVRRGNRYV